MHFQKLTGACLLAFASFSWADSLPQNNYLWGADGMGKMVRRATTKKTTTTSSTKTSSSSVKTSTSTSSSKSSSSSTSSKSSSTVVSVSTSTSSTTSSAKSSSTSSSSTVSTSSTTSSLVADSACTNGPLTRSCWGGGYSIATDFDQKHPNTGVTVTYNLEITNTTCNPDGNGAQTCYLINGQFPGPTLFGNWGDTMVVNLKNSLQDNGTSLHFHGVRQFGSTGSDGVGGITECPLAPGQSKTYTFLLTQFGTSWYHSHYSSQYGMGIAGPMVINGPATANYDVDLGTFPVNDWYYATANEVNEQALATLQLGAAPPPGSNFLVNGTNVNANGGGSYAKVTVTPGKKHRLRLINTSVDNAIRVKLDSHLLTIITADFIPVTAIPGQDWILLGIGQRHDVVFTANQTAGTYWFRAEAAGDCFSTNSGSGRALFTYSGQTVTAPTDSDETPPTNGCKELTTVPYWKQAVDSSTFASQVESLATGVAEGVNVNGKSMVLWNLDTTAITIHWDDPTLQYLFDGNTSYPTAYDVIEIPNEGVWTYWLIQMSQNSPPLPHPIHLHGHDFFVLGSGSGTFDASTDTASLNFANPPRRDTSILPGLGWLALAFEANNPGAWLMHCHIAWHISEGLGVQFIEAKNSIVFPDKTDFDNQCSAWKSYSATMAFPQIDSGL